MILLRTELRDQEALAWATRIRKHHHRAYVYVFQVSCVGEWDIQYDFT